MTKGNLQAYHSLWHGLRARVPDLEQRKVRISQQYNTAGLTTASNMHMRLIIRKVQKDLLQ